MCVMHACCLMLSFKLTLLTFMFMNFFFPFNLQVGLSCTSCSCSYSEFFIGLGSYSIWGCWKKSWPTYRFVMLYILIGCSKNWTFLVIFHFWTSCPLSLSNIVLDKSGAWHSNRNMSHFIVANFVIGYIVSGATYRNIYNNVTSVCTFIGCCP